MTRAAAIVAVLAAATVARAEAPPPVKALKITILSTMLADAGVGEWGFSALVEVDGHRLLFDTGARPDTVLTNAAELKIDLSTVEEVVLSHNHSDHTGGLLTLRRALAKKNPAALSRVHVGQGIFASRPDGKAEGNTMLEGRARLLAAGVKLIEHDAPVQLYPGVWLTGPVPRVHPERNWSGSGQLVGPSGLVEDTIPEDQSLVFDTPSGLVLLSGCGHAGVINTAEYARKVVRAAPLHAAVGGFHLFPLDDEKLAWTIGKLRELGLQQLLGAHCTGLEAVRRVQDGLKLSRRACRVGAVGASFTLGTGIDPLRIAR